MDVRSVFPVIRFLSYIHIPCHYHPFPTTHHPFTRRSGAVGEVKGGWVVKVLSSEGSVSLLVRSRRISPLSLVTSPHHFGSVPWDERGERRQKEDRTEWDETERGRSRHSSSVVGLVHYVHHPTPSSERSDRREWIIGCGPRVREMKGMWSERNVNETRLSSLSLASPRIPASARPSHPRLLLLSPPQPEASESNGVRRGWPEVGEVRGTDEDVSGSLLSGLYSSLHHLRPFSLSPPLVSSGPRPSFLTRGPSWPDEVIRRRCEEARR